VPSGTVEDLKVDGAKFQQLNPPGIHAGEIGLGQPAPPQITVVRNPSLGPQHRYQSAPLPRPVQQHPQWGHEDEGPLDLLPLDKENDRALAGHTDQAVMNHKVVAGQRSPVQRRGKGDTITQAVAR